MKIVNVEGPITDPQTFQPHMRITVDMPLEVQTEERTLEQNAMIIYKAWTQALVEWNNSQLADRSDSTT